MLVKPADARKTMWLYSEELKGEWYLLDNTPFELVTVPSLPYEVSALMSPQGDVIEVALQESYASVGLSEVVILVVLSDRNSGAYQLWKFVYEELEIDGIRATVLVPHLVEKEEFDYFSERVKDAVYTLGLSVHEPSREVRDGMTTLG